MTTELSKVLSYYQESIDKKLRELLGTCSEVALLDCPIHMNIGDSLIWTGELETLRRLDVSIAHASDIRLFKQNSLNYVSASTPLLLHGGGNFGDVWPKHQRFREQIVRDNPKRKIIFLPQTIYFQDRAKAYETNQVFQAHGNVHIMVRDSKSLLLGRELMPAAKYHYSFDTALGNPLLISNEKKTKSWLILERQDRESKGNLVPITHKSRAVEVADWQIGTFAKLRYLCSYTLIATLTLLPSRGIFFRARNAGFLKLPYILVNEGVKQFSPFSRVITNRLHAHILAGLMSIQNYVCENNYGKIEPIFNEYTHQLPGSSFITNEDEIRNLIS